MKTRFVYLLICIHLAGFANSQSLWGSWTGWTAHSIFILNPVKELLEIEGVNDSCFTGVIHSYYTRDRFEHIKVYGIINWKDSILHLVEQGEISTNINKKFYDLCLGEMRLRITKSGQSYQLNGKWKDKDRGFFNCPTLATRFEKSFSEIEESSRFDSLTVRPTDIQKVVDFDLDEIDSIKCDLYDNGVVDDDTASVYFNDKLIIGNQRLSESPIEFFVSFDKSKGTQKIKLFANNLGRIPPNTALLEVTTKKNHYSLTLSSDFSHNAAVEFFLKE